jgi:hypothetical protein
MGAELRVAGPSSRPPVHQSPSGPRLTRQSIDLPGPGGNVWPPLRHPVVIYLRSLHRYPLDDAVLAPDQGAKALPGCDEVDLGDVNFSLPALAPLCELEVGRQRFSRTTGHWSNRSRFPAVQLVVFRRGPTALHQPPCFRAARASARAARRVNLSYDRCFPAAQPNHQRYAFSACELLFLQPLLRQLECILTMVCSRFEFDQSERSFNIVPTQ